MQGTEESEEEDNDSNDFHDQRMRVFALRAPNSLQSICGVTGWMLYFQEKAVQDEK